jgi:uncharacterized protein YeaC (DUF1315 family)
MSDCEYECEALRLALRRGDELKARAEKTEAELALWRQGHLVTEEQRQNCLDNQTAYDNLRKSRNAADDECTRLTVALVKAEAERDEARRQLQHGHNTELCIKTPAGEAP